MGNFIRKYGLLVYWVLFLPLVFYQSQFPGLMLNPEEWQYPWSAAIIVCLILFILIGILQLILRPISYSHSWGRLVIALIYSALLLYAGLMTVATDLPGYFYVPAQFSVINMAVMLSVAGVLLTTKIVSRVRNEA